VLVPGMEGSDRLFYRQLPLLARHFTTASVSLRADATTMEELIDDLDRAVKNIDAPGGRVIVVGESFGGAVALSYALARPERVQALVVLNSFPYFAPRIRLRLARNLLRLIPVGAMAFVRRLTAARLHSAHTHRNDIARFMELTRQMDRRGYLNRLRMLEAYDVRPRLGEIRVPALFLASECDRLVPSVAQARLMARLVSGARVQILEGHGHICLIAPDVDLSAILRTWMSTWQ
jgi:pimeloyl-ACP methyl ester carboxylesterase